MYRNAIELDVVSDDPEKNFILFEMMALPLVRENEIQATYDKLKRKAQNAYQDFFSTFFKLFERFWLHERGIEAFCVFDQLFRTSNFENQYQSAMYSRAKHQRPCAWKFLGNI